MRLWNDADISLISFISIAEEIRESKEITSFAARHGIAFCYINRNLLEKGRGEFSTAKFNAGTEGGIRFKCSVKKIPRQ